MTSKFTSLSEIIERVYRTTDLESINWQDMAEDCIDVIRLLGVPKGYMDKTTNGIGDNPVPIIIDDFRGELPYDLAVPGPCRMIQLDQNGSITKFRHMIESMDLFYQSPTVREQYNTSYRESSSTLVATSLEMKMDEAQQDIDNGDITDATTVLDDVITDIRLSQSRIVTSSTTNQDFFPKYKLNGDYIFTNFKHGYVEMAYKAYPVDDMGMPMIPDNIKFVKAVEWYLISRIDYKKWRSTGLKHDADMWQNSDKEALWYMQSARSAAHQPSLDQMESIKRMILRSITKINEHSSGFKSTNNQEMRKF